MNNIYRAQEVNILTRWINAKESGTVVGVPGAGRFTLLKFICENPPQQNPAQVVLVPVDLINLPIHDTATLYRTILRSFSECDQQFNRLIQDQIRHCYRRIRRETDPFASQSALRELLLCLKSQKVTVGLVMSRFDRFLANATWEMGNTLRGLRDSFKQTLFYIVSLPKEIIYLSDLPSVPPLRTILDTNVCWVGPLVDQDAHAMITHRTQHLTIPFTAQNYTDVTRVTGGFPSLLRIICRNWEKIKAHEPFTPQDGLTNAFWKTPSIQDRLSQIWDALTQEESAVLAELAIEQLRLHKNAKLKTQLPDITQKYQEVLHRLIDINICHTTDQGAMIKSDLLTMYAADQIGLIRGRIRLDKGGAIYQGEKELDKLEPLGRNLLTFFIQNPHTRHTHTTLIEAAWPDDVNREGVANDPLYQSIRKIRKLIEPDLGTPRYVITWRGQPEGGYQFFPEGKPTTID